ncbi:unnamed protein product, partial [Dovyalis caffra]
RFQAQNATEEIGGTFGHHLVDHKGERKGCAGRAGGRGCSEVWEKVVGYSNKRGAYKL